MGNKGLLIGLGVLVAAVVIGAGFLLFGGNKGTSTYTQTTRSPSPTTTVQSSPQGSPTSGSSGQEVREITISGSEYKFTPGTINIKTGERVRITFRNTGRLPHNLTIDELDVETDTTPAGKETTVEFTASKGGTFTAYCRVGNHRALGMEGKVEVK